MTRDQNQRTVINIYRMFMAQIGSLAINAFTLPFINGIGGSSSQKSWIIVSVIYGFIAAALFFLCFVKTKERVLVSMQQKETIGLLESFKLIMKNNYWLLIVGIWVCMALGMSLSMGVGTYYAKYILGDENMAGFFTAVSILPVIVCMPAVVPLSKKYGKRNVALFGSLISLAGQIMMLVYPASAAWLMVCSLVKGVGSAALAIIGAAGYDGLAAVQTAEAVSAIKMVYLALPVPFLIAIPVFYKFYKLDEIYPTVMKELEEGENKQQQ